MPQDYSAAAVWYRLAADQGSADAQFFLGHMYLVGQGVQQDYIEAGKWERMAAEHSYAAAQSELENLEHYNADFLVMLESWRAAKKWPPPETVVSKRGQGAEIARLLGWTTTKGDGPP